MSHTVQISQQFKVEEIDNLKKAFETLGWNWVENGSARQYSGKQEYKYVAINPGGDSQAFDIGIKEDGETLSLFTDFWGGSVENKLGKDLAKLKQEYSYEVICSHFMNDEVTREEQEDGSLIVDIRQY